MASAVFARHTKSVSLVLFVRSRRMLLIYTIARHTFCFNWYIRAYRLYYNTRVLYFVYAHKMYIVHMFNKSMKAFLNESNICNIGIGNNLALSYVLYIMFKRASEVLSMYYSP